MPVLHFLVPQMVLVPVLLLLVPQHTGWVLAESPPAEEVYQEVKLGPCHA